MDIFKAHNLVHKGCTSGAEVAQLPDSVPATSSNLDEPYLNLNATHRIFNTENDDTLPDDNPAKTPEFDVNLDELKEIQKKLPPEYCEYSSVFSKSEADILPEHRKYDMEINIIPKQKVPWGPIYPLSEPELKVLKDYLDTELKKGFI